MRVLLTMVILLLCLRPSPSTAQDDVVIETVDLGGGVYALVGGGGTMGLSVGKDGAFLVDDQYAPLTGKILAAIAALTDEPVRFVINTHWHGDHTGGNENLGESGAVILAHENVRARMSVDQFRYVFDQETPASPEGALPMVTFTDAVTFHMNGQTIRVFHVENAHTDGDCMIHFEEANVLHMGDVLFNRVYPFIDVAAGGTYRGTVDAVDLALSLIDDETRIIAGHGETPATREDLEAYRHMLVTLIERFEQAIAEGKTLEEIQEANLTEEFDADWDWRFITTARMVRILYDDLGPAGDTRTDDRGVEQVWVPAGSFQMGTGDTTGLEPPRWALAELASEQPQHKVRITEGFWIDTYEVTNAAFREFVEDGGYENEEYWSEPGREWLRSQKRSAPVSCVDEVDDHPRVCVTWYEAEAYARWRGGRLPTQAEWEYAARGPDSRIYPWGDSFHADRCNVVDSSGPVPVGSYPFGVSWVGAHDMAGNAMEWVQDWLDPGYYENRIEIDPPGPETGKIKIEKGGWWGSNPFVARSAYHHFEDPPTYQDHHIGFRVVTEQE